MANELLFGSDARKKIAEGIKILSDAVRVTLGPSGKNVIIEQEFGSPQIINDGVTIAKNIVLSDQYQNLGASLIIEAASKTNDVAGDGTTTAVILASECILKGLKKLDSGISPVEIKEGFEYYLPIIINKIKERSTQLESLEDLKRIATLSSGSKEIGSIIAEAYGEVGVDGKISVEESKGLETTLDIVKGYAYDRGYASSYMVSDQTKNIAILDNPDILVTNRKITTMQEIIPFLENAMKTGHPLLIICDDISPEVLSTVVMNKLRGTFNVVITKAPSFGNRELQYLTDIAVLTSAKLISAGLDEELTNQPLSILGSAQLVKVSSNETIIIDGKGSEESIINYVEGLKNAFLNEESNYEKDLIKIRIAKIFGGVAQIKVGAATEVELQDKKLRLEDAICATKAATEEGIIEGAGKVFYEISEELKEYKEFINSRDILISALKEPFYQLLSNACLSIDKIKHLLDKEHWFNGKTKQVEKISESKILDPASVEIAAITNALSIAGIVLTTECAIISKEIKSKVGDDLL